MQSDTIEQIVRQVLENLGETTPGKQNNNTPAFNPGAPIHTIPPKAKAAVLTAHEKIEIKEFPIPELGDNDILVRVEG